MLGCVLEKMGCFLLLHEMPIKSLRSLILLECACSMTVLSDKIPDCDRLAVRCNGSVMISMQCEFAHISLCSINSTV
jgi:hypothetical protein